LDLKSEIVSLPFAGFKWRWMEVTPVESFNRADVLLGVTRAIKKCVGKRASSVTFSNAMKTIQDDLFPSGTPNLVPPDRSRNVIRRQGRYWRGLGILESAGSSYLALTKFGEDFADGSLTKADFVSSIIKNHTLPNPRLENTATINEWRSAGISIQPLQLIVRCILALNKRDTIQGYLTPLEVARVLVPLTIKMKTFTLSDYVDALMQFRVDSSVADHMPNCTPDSNDQRMIREHFLFLKNFDVLESHNVTSHKDDIRYHINIADVERISTLLEMKVSGLSTSPTPMPVEVIEVRYDPTNTRERKTVELSVRPNQAVFRRIVLMSGKKRCLITKEDTIAVLDACHIREIHDGGTDHPGNGICLRKDLHALYDRGKLRINENGDIFLSPDIVNSVSYSGLPKKIRVPKYVDKTMLRHRSEYGV
jgi:hypothetical protein